MTLRVIGAGLGRTGTHSLMIALEKLFDQPCYHMVVAAQNPSHTKIWHDAALGKMPDWIEFFDGYGAAVDWPACSFWPEISAAFPDALILLSTRDSEAWWKSANNTIFSTFSGRKNERQAMLDQLFESRFTSKIDDRDAAIAAFEASNAHVRETVPPGRLLEWQVGDGWEPICAALGLPVPSEPFPQTNSTEEFLVRRAARLADSAA
jgi:hypothetical protein